MPAIVQKDMCAKLPATCAGGVRLRSVSMYASQSAYEQDTRTAEVSSERCNEKKKRSRKKHPKSAVIAVGCASRNGIVFRRLIWQMRT